MATWSMHGSDIVGAEGKAETEIVKGFDVEHAWNRSVKPSCRALSTEAVDNIVDECRITGCMPCSIATSSFVYKK